MFAFTGRKLVLMLLGSVVAVSASYGSWEMWTSFKPAPPDIETIAQPIPIAQVVVPSQTPAPKVEAPKAIPVPVKRTEPTPVEEVRTKELPTGKKHLKQDDLLLAMAMQLHGEAYHHFILQQGLGRSRMIPMISLVAREWKMPEWTSEEITKEQPPQKGAKDLSMIHRLSLNQFSASNGQASTTKQPNVVKEQPWEIHSLDLIGLVVHEVPKVYVSRKLPQMKDLKTTPIRDMDLFESEGLEELANGKELYVRSKQDVVRVLGPIRASNACLKCHGDAKNGDMLGAFSYTLRIAQLQQGNNGRGQGNPLPPTVIRQVQP
jgi:hypothetical protein